MYEQPVQPRGLKIFSLDGESLLPHTLEVGVSKTIMKFFGTRRVNELALFVEWLITSLNLTSSKAISPKTDISVEISKRKPGTTYNGAALNSVRPREVFVDAFVAMEMGVVDAYRHVMETISHEFIHLKQYAWGELSAQKGLDGLSRWNWEGGIMEQHKDYAQYLNFPWEREAYHNQSRLVDGWMRRCTALGHPSALTFSE